MQKNNIFDVWKNFEIWEKNLRNAKKFVTSFLAHPAYLHVYT